MSDPVWTDQPRKLLLELRSLIGERASAEAGMAAGFQSAGEAAEKQYQESRKEATARYEKDRAEADEQYLNRRSEVIAQFQSDHSATEEEYDQLRAAVVARFEEAEQAEKKRLQDTRWQSNAVFEAAKNRHDAGFKEAQQDLDAFEQQVLAVRQDLEQLLRRRHQSGAVDPPAPPTLSSGIDPRAQCRAAVAQAREQVREMLGDSLSGLFEGSQPLGIVVVVSVASVVPAAFLLGPSRWYWVVLVAIAAVVLSVGLLRWLYLSARRRTMEQHREVLSVLAYADACLGRILEGAKAEWEKQSSGLTLQLEAELAAADEAHARVAADLAARKQETLRQAADEFAATRSFVTSRHNAQRRELDERHARLLEELEVRYRNESTALEQGYARAAGDREARCQREWDAMRARWLRGLAELEGSIQVMNDACARWFPPWDDPAWGKWAPPTSIPPIAPLGRLDFELADFENGVPTDERLVPERSEFSVPVALTFHDRSLVLLKAEGEGRSRAVEALQAVMLRMLTSLPPGKVRFLILDPVGLGENFSAFMHLADDNEKLVFNRIWTDGAHLERRLGELTEHMENVIQVYLRNEFQSLQQYNATAGNLAEPYRVLVVADFPASFSELAARRLVSIVSSGARCGVYTLMSLDTAQRLPRDFQLDDLQRHALRLHWSEGQFVWEVPELGNLPLALEKPPPAERFTELVRRVGREARDADRIELPFDWVVPKRSEWWTQDSRAGLDVPLGRAGVNKLQLLQLGKGTSQHVLIAGKTGSGKSTLLHVLIINVALRYSPDEVELYLVDFKKGVEFKAYAEQEIPHARVIAIESEREFGLSVLERLDLELKRRGDLFRERGVQDLSGFRAAEPKARMPRVLLVVDEFQELFVEDDRIAQTAALLLDRLVRQGRAFGIHVLLGSQTLAGAYSIPRSTIGQMAVRIALQCSEADAHLILSEENTAARLLARPGEAIYNDANGLYEGNHPFQVVWLADELRQSYLERLREWTTERGFRAAAPVVFEGNQPADPGKNPMLVELLEGSHWPGPCASTRLWLGEPVSIKEPTAASLTRQAGAHLLVVGHQEDSARGILAAGLVSLAAQHSPTRSDQDGIDAQFYVLDGTRPDDPRAGFWNRLAEQLPHGIRIIAPRAAAAAIAAVAEELARREQAGEDNAMPLYLVVYDLARFRELRKADDDYGFGHFDEGKPPSSARQFRTILRDGPSLGIHALIWADSYGSAMRSLDRQGLEDIELRVAFRMNQGDSSSLIDSPAASQLGVHRAIFDDESLGRLEKFRPYGLPSAEWLAWVGERLRSRGPAPASTSKRAKGS